MASPPRRACCRRPAPAPPRTRVIPDRVVPTFCELCFWKCGVLAYVKDDKVYKLEGNPKHPLSNGKLCPRGAGGVGALYDPDRLKTPADPHEGRRRGDVARGELGRGARPHRQAAHRGEGEVRRAEHRALLATATAAPSSRRCSRRWAAPPSWRPRTTSAAARASAGFELTYGARRRRGGDHRRAQRQVHRLLRHAPGREHAQHRGAGRVGAPTRAAATFITVDPRFSIIASKSKYWLPIKPGTDTALLLAWAHVLIDEGRYQKEFVEKNAVGFEQLKAHVKDKTPEWALRRDRHRAERHPRDGARAGEERARRRWCTPAATSSGTATTPSAPRAIAIVNALLGNWGKKGGFYLPASHDRRRATPRRPLPHGEAYKPRVKFPLATAPCAYDVCDASHRQARAAPATHPRVDGLRLQRAADAAEHRRATIEAMKQLDFVVAIDTMPAEVTGYADVVLPENTYLERYDDLEASPFRVPYVALRQPVVRVDVRHASPAGGSPRASPSSWALGAVLPLEGRRGLPVARACEKSKLVVRAAQARRRHRGRAGAPSTTTRR